MSFLTYKPLIEDGDLVILYLGFSRVKHLRVKKDETYQTQFGAVRHNDLIGSRYGSRVKTSRGWVYVLHPTPELWTITLPHRTQILYSTDISMVVFQLDLSPGKIVLESGTGSGSLSHALARAVAPSGHVHTFEFHAGRADQARDEFVEHGLGDVVTIRQRDVCVNGFGLEGVADAVFLDLPSPWEAIPHAKTALKKSGGRVCSFSPCIEQVQRACETLRDLGFREISTMEVLLREFNVQTTNMAVPDLGFETLGETTPGSGQLRSDAGTREPQVGLVQKTSESRKGRKPPFQRREKGAKQPRRDESNTPSGAGGDMSNAPNAAGGEGDESNSPATAGEEETRDDNGKELGHPANEPGAMETKKEPGDAVKDAGNTETTSKQSATDANNDADVVAMETENKMAADVADESRETRGDAAREAVTRSVFLCKSAAPKLVIPGHTGYLTFATLFPEFTSS